MSTLFIVATPIGNLEDITFRAIKILSEVDLILAEDTRRTKILLNKYNIENKKIKSFHSKTSAQKSREIFANLKDEEKVAYVSDAGTPGISDPGFVLIQEALKCNLNIVPIPGASAVTTLVSVAGVPVNKFTFYGFIPHKKGRQTFIKNFINSDQAEIFYESVHRFPRLLDELNEFLESDRIIVVGRELTKMYEEIFRGTLENSREFFHDKKPKGEYCIIVAPTGFAL